MPKGVHGNHARADRQHQWAADRKIMASTGYVKVRVGRDHPLADPNGYAYEHLVVWVSSGREKPAPGMILHHRNGVQTDNRLGNLELLSRGEHNRLHMVARQRDPQTGRLLPAGNLLDGVQHQAFPRTTSAAGEAERG